MQSTLTHLRKGNTYLLLTPDMGYVEGSKYSPHSIAGSFTMLANSVPNSADTDFSGWYVIQIPDAVVISPTLWEWRYDPGRTDHTAYWPTLHLVEGALSDAAVKAIQVFRTHQLLGVEGS